MHPMPFWLKILGENFSFETPSESREKQPEAAVSCSTSSKADRVELTLSRVARLCQFEQAHETRRRAIWTW